MTARKPAPRRKPAKPEPAKCPDCDGVGESTESVRVGARKHRTTADQQTGLCLTCWGSGEAPTD
ncbi:hypothetical protein GCM10011579_059980 [Streptomyces albiflavescens]|uniref:Uncharacterized protein n=1 Tax=Streptomyces albiflavescens TaxID=1623582 RepID=A0A918D7J6_9ACTN|nr:hypothetical protein [Streptomyces albiflavescens]GGN77580.1 hypothetical protein GCM10011579_059980 [Streptomyces albiflavescens]